MDRARGTWNALASTVGSRLCLQENTPAKACLDTYLCSEATLRLLDERKTKATSELSIQVDSSLNCFPSLNSFFSLLLLCAELCLQIALGQLGNTLGK